MNKSSLVAGVFIALSASVAAQSNSPGERVITITHGLPQVSSGTTATTESVQASPVSDGGELLTGLNGISATRMGGRSLDPLIRGQKHNQLNVVLDGAYLHGGCPNRMDPPTSYTAVDTYDQVTVIKGNRSVIHGAGGSGGTVLFERAWPDFKDNNLSAKLAGSYHGNGQRKELGADLAAGSEQGYVRLTGHKTDAGNYRDGNNKRVRSSYKSDANALLGGIKLGQDSWLEGSFEKAGEEDVLFPGAGMDSPYADAETVRLKFSHNFSGKHLRQLRLNVYRADVEHLMDNFSLRTPGMMTIKAPSSSDTKGMRLLLDARLADIQWTFGSDAQNNRRTATAINNKNNRSVGIQWPDARIRQLGLFAEGRRSVDTSNTLKAGVRYDRISAQAQRSKESIESGPLAGKTPEQVWGGKSGARTTENNLSGFVSWAHRLNHHYTTELTLSRSVRSADATERYMAMGKWRGNPDLKPERHHQAELSLQSQDDTLSWSVSGWYNRINDYILRSKTGNFDSYNNVAARIIGLEAEAKVKLSQHWQLNSGLTWLKGTNTKDNQPLSHISPLELSANLEYRTGHWKAGTRLKLVHRQNRVCLNSAACGGQDVRKTPGFALVNLYGEYRLNSALTLLAGVDNLLDKAYSRHESRNDAFNPAPVQVAEPGRSLWLRVSSRF